MTHLGKDAGGHLTKHANGHLEKCELVCPTDCSGCPSTYVVTIDSISNPSDACFIGIICGQMSTASPATVTRAGCTWTDLVNGYATIECLDIGGTLYWRARIGWAASCQLYGIASLAGNPCPPTGGVGVWTDQPGPNCSGQISVA